MTTRKLNIRADSIVEKFFSKKIREFYENTGTIGEIFENFRQRFPRLASFNIARVSGIVGLLHENHQKASSTPLIDFSVSSGPEVQAV